MKGLTILCALALVCVSVALPLRAQQPAQAGSTQAFGPASAPGGDAAGAPAKDYPLGPGDVIELRVFGEPQFDGSYDVDDEGRLTVPFIEQPLDVRCRNINQIRKEVTTALGRLIREPRIYMRVKEQHSRRPAVVYGAVRQPLRFEMHRRARLLELLSNSGGVTEQTNGTIQITHTELSVCPEPDEIADATSGVQGVDDLGVPFNVYKVADLKLGKPEANPFIRPGDIVYVAEASPVYVTGAVVAPQGIYMHERMSLTTAIYMVGGIKKEAKTGEVHIYRQKENGLGREMITADFRKIQRKQAADIELHAYDVIEVPEKGFDILTFLKGFATQSVTSVAQGAGYRVIY